MSHWFYSDGASKCGPYSSTEMHQFLKSRTISDSTRVWKQGMGEWQPLNQCKLDAEIPPPIDFVKQRKQKESSMILKTNEVFFGFKGALGRWGYFKLCILNMLMFVFFGLGPMAYGAYLLDTPTASNALGGIMILFSLGTYIFASAVGYGMLLRRVKDISGTHENAHVYTVGTLVAMMIPYVGIFASLAVGLWPGTVSKKSSSPPPKDEYETPEEFAA
jgi:uncharacterized membrane protein YhaH (DUF805 family)